MPAEPGAAPHLLADHDLAGRRVVVTGASRGIGAAIAERCCAEGADVLLTARTVERHDHLAGSLTETVARCRHYGTRVETLAADLADGESRAAIIPHALALFDGRVDVLVNNAAAAIYQPLADFPLRRRRVIFEVNVHAPLDLAQQVVPSMRERGEGWIVNLSSGAARPAAGPPFPEGALGTTSAVYGASKAALNKLTNALAIELYGTGIRVNTLEPRAAVMSEGAEVLVGGKLSDDQIESMEAMVEATLALCTCEAERTGQTFVSLDLLDVLARPVMTLDGAGRYPGGYRPVG